MSSFNETASLFGLHTSWPNTKIQNLGSGPEPLGITVDGNPVDAVSNFVYLGSLQSSDGYCTTDIRGHISLTALVMSSLDSICKDRRLSTLIKIWTYLTLVQSVLMYALGFISITRYRDIDRGVGDLAIIACLLYTSPSPRD